MTRTRTMTVRGHTIRTASTRRFVVVAVREHDIHVAHEPDNQARVLIASIDGDFVRAQAQMHGREVSMFVRFARVERRTDSIDTARTVARRSQQRGDSGRGVAFVIVDSFTGEEVQ